MKLRILILSVAVFLLSLFLLIRHYTNAREKSLNEDITIAQTLLKNGRPATAVYDTVYTETKIGGSKHKLIKYYYDVEGKQFEGSKQIKELPATPVLDIVYLPSDPTTHLENPALELESLVRQKEDKSTSGLPWGLFSGSIIVFFITRKLYLNEKAEEREMGELERQYAKRGKSNSPDVFK